MLERERERQRPKGIELPPERGSHRWLRLQFYPTGMIMGAVTGAELAVVVVGIGVRATGVGILAESLLVSSGMVIFGLLGAWLGADVERTVRRGR